MKILELRPGQRVENDGIPVKIEAGFRGLPSGGSRNGPRRAREIMAALACWKSGVRSCWLKKPVILTRSRTEAAAANQPLQAPTIGSGPTMERSTARHFSAGTRPAWIKLWMPLHFPPLALRHVDGSGTRHAHEEFLIATHARERQP